MISLADHNKTNLIILPASAIPGTSHGVATWKVIIGWRLGGPEPEEVRLSCLPPSMRLHPFATNTASNAQTRIDAGIVPGRRRRVVGRWDADSDGFLRPSRSPPQHGLERLGVGTNLVATMTPGALAGNGMPSTGAVPEGLDHWVPHHDAKSTRITNITSCFRPPFGQYHPTACDVLSSDAKTKQYSVIDQRHSRALMKPINTRLSSALLTRQLLSPSPSSTLAPRIIQFHNHQHHTKPR